MWFFVFLTINLAVTLFCCVAVWRRTRSLAFPFGFAVIYFWTFHGAWSIVSDLVAGTSEKNYQYLFDKMFGVQLDANYAWALGLYAAFALVIALTALGWSRQADFSGVQCNPLGISHDRILVVGGAAAIISLWVVHSSLDMAIGAGTSAYTETRSSTEIGWFRIHQLLNRAALIPAAIGCATLFSHGGHRLLQGTARLRHYWGYFLLIGFMFCFCVVLGNKSELVFALFSASLFYLANSIRPRLRLLTVCGIIVMACVGYIDHARRFPIDQIVSNSSLADVANSFLRIAESNECFAAHISLHGILSHDVPLTYGSSLVSFAASLIPHSLWPDRPEDIYTYYVRSVGAIEGQGYTVHHASGWYLNFGIIGVIFGGFLLGRIWAGLYNHTVSAASQHAATWWRVFRAIGFFTFTASLPSIVRNGPEIYKSVLVESFLIPVAILSFARVPSIRRGIVNASMPVAARRARFKTSEA